MGFLGQLFGNYMQSKQYRGQAKVARAQGELERANAYLQAARTEDEGKAGWIINTENATRLRENQTGAKASARNRRANSGFTSEGSGIMEELSVAEQMEVMIQDTALSGAIAERNAAEEARVMRVNGDIASIEAEGEAQVYESLAANAKKAALAQGLAGLAGTVLGAFTGGGVTGALKMGGAFGNIAGQFTQYMPGTVAASKSSSEAFGTDINEVWKAFGGRDLFGNGVANYATGSKNLPGGVVWTDGRERH